MKKILALVLSVFIVLVGCSDDGVTIEKGKNKYNYEDAVTNLGKLYDKIDWVGNNEPSEGVALDDSMFEDTNLYENLPDFTTTHMPIVSAVGDYVTMISSTEKAGTGNDGWLTEVVKKWNSSNSPQIELYSVPSGEAFDYIRSGKYTPDLFTPSNALWGDALNLTPVADKLCGNVAGIVSKEGYTAEEIITKVTNGEIQFGYTNPFASSTGINFLIEFTENLSTQDAFLDFQKNIPFVSYTTLQMRNAALNGVLDAFVYESQQFYNTKDLVNNYKFVPFGIRHDSPLYALNAEKHTFAEDFADFCLTSDNQKSAEKCGFNKFDDYENSGINGFRLLEEQLLYKEKKNEGAEQVAVFVCDLSGSMSGTPLAQLKKGLVECSKEISDNCSIGVVTYADDVDISLGIGEYDLKHRSKLLKVVQNMVSGGGTSTNSALVVAEDMIEKYKATKPNAKYSIFLLTDGETTSGLTYDICKDVFQSLEVPIYAIAYNDGSSELAALADLNEAAYISVDDTNAVYALSNFFKAQF